ncbi:MAG: NADH:ubiquinone oxidoreductase subunit NDUFA12 [Paracoccaceae bacterium]|nr:NADH:ubiquinone oxidoreductase subunit NDUFA12 [Paracoccaceae bacterium]MDE2915248.1 NADH:ubiquinone oxidoreductase subunit NDUFA12 [Paracoccaceae bacterium]
MSLKRLFTWWNGQTLNTQFHTWLHGEFVGEDNQGNRYFRRGPRRWVIYNGEAESSRIPPEWHGWLHHTAALPPSESPPVRKAWEKPHVENLTGTDGAYAPPGSLRSPNPELRPDYEAWVPE